MSTSRNHYDAVIVGGGHNGLTAAAYLARAGRSVLVLERLPEVGGAAVSRQPFAGHSARLSRYSYLVALLPDRLLADLDLDLRLSGRSTSSYTPYDESGLLVEHTPGATTADSMRALTGSDEAFEAWRTFYNAIGSLATVVEPTLMTPLPRAREIERLVDPAVWRDFVKTPVSSVIEQSFSDDLIRGVVATDAVIGALATPDDPGLLANRLFLYHLMGNGTGEWRVPVGGMGAVTAALQSAAVSRGAEILCNAGVSSIMAGPDGAEVTWHDGSQERTVTGRFVLGNTAPWVLDILLGHPAEPATKPVGAQLKINLLLDRLPRLKSGIDPAVAFAGTFHIDEGYTSLRTAYDEATRGQLPTTIPGEIYCHTLTDDSILDGHPGHTMTYFGLHTPPAVFESDPVGIKALAVERAIAGIDAYLAEPLLDCLARDADGKPCLEAKIPQEIEAELAMPGGNIYHGELDWPWASPRAALDTPAQRWGVATDEPSVFVCGAGARRGGGVSGIGGQNAAQAVLESL